MTTPPAGRNDPCPCGSGRKYKKCCGAPGAEPKGAAAPPAATTDVERPLADARALIARGAFRDAERLIMGAIDRSAPDHRLLAELGRLRVLHGRPSAALAPLRTAVADRPEDVDLLMLLASACHADRRLEEASRALEQASRVAPRNPQIWSLLATLHRDRNDAAAAADAADRAYDLDPTSAPAAAAHAAGLRDAGRTDEALAIADRAVALAGPGAQVAMAEVHQLRASLLEKAGRDDEAWDAWIACNRAQAADPAFGSIDRGRATAWIEAYRRHLPPGEGPTAELVGDGPPFDLLVGFSRSGTTLTEQVLAGHPNVTTSAERPIIQRLKRSLGQVANDPDAFARRIAAMDVDELTSLRRRLREIAVSEVEHSGRRIVHKHPMDSIELPLLDRIAPDARVLFAVRDPRDVVLSCFRQVFIPNMINVHFLAIDDAARLHAAVIGSWLDMRERLRLPWMELRYEDVVEDLESSARAQLAHLQLEWSDEVLAFHQKAASRHITTPSAAAVREPVHRRAVGGWRRHARHMETACTTLAAVVSAWGYGESTVD